MALTGTRLFPTVVKTQGLVLTHRQALRLEVGAAQQALQSVYGESRYFSAMVYSVIKRLAVIVSGHRQAANGVAM